MTAKLPLELGETELATVKAILAMHVPDAEVWVFGSRATGQSKKYSDLDLCIKANHSLGLDVMSALAEDFSESDLPWKVDIVDWWCVSDEFRAIIGRDRIELASRVSKT